MSEIIEMQEDVWYLLKAMSNQETSHSCVLKINFGSEHTFDQIVPAPMIRTCMLFSIAKRGHRRAL